MTVTSNTTFSEQSIAHVVFQKLKNNLHFPLEELIGIVIDTFVHDGLVHVNGEWSACSPNSLIVH